MDSLIERRWLRLEAGRRALLDFAATVEPSKFLAPPAPGKWSIALILLHLLTVERMSLSYMKKKHLGAHALHKAGRAAALRSAWLKWVLRLPIKLKAPRQITDRMPAAMPLEEVRGQWDEVRSALHGFLSGLPEEDLHKPIYKHFLAGRMTPLQSLNFFHDHILHHLPQIERIAGRTLPNGSDG